MTLGATNTIIPTRLEDRAGHGAQRPYRALGPNIHAVGGRHRGDPATGLGLDLMKHPARDM